MMRIFPGARASPNIGTLPLGVAVNLDVLEINQDVSVAGSGGSTGAGPGVSGQPVQTCHGPLYRGARMSGYLDYFYNRIHLLPGVIDLGNVVSEQVREITLWNAYFAPRALTAVDEIGTEGIVLTGQSSPPLGFGPLQVRKWRISVSTDGPPVVDARVTWRFQNEPDAWLVITGNRVTAWTLAPDWHDGVSERLDWLTELLGSPSGVEQRRALRIAPRRTFEATMLAAEQERILLDMSLYGWGGRVWALPLWPDVQRLSEPVRAGENQIRCDNRWRDFRAGGLALLRGDSAFDYEVMEIATVADDKLTLTRPAQRNWPLGTALYPMRTAQLTEQPELTRLSDRLQRVKAQFLVMEASDVPETLPETLYRGWPVLERRPDESEDITATWQRLQATLDNQTALPQITDLADLAFPVLSHRWRVHGREEQAQMRGLFYALRGRQKSLWVPTHGDDLQLISVMAPNGRVFDIRICGLGRFFRVGAPGRRDIRIELIDGTAFHRRITGVTEIDAETERVSIDAELGREIRPERVNRISFMSLCRLDQDHIEIHHATDSDGSASAQAIFRGVRDEL